MKERKDAYFRKFKNDTRIIVMKAGLTQKERYELMEAFKGNWKTFVCDDSFRFIEVPKDSNIEVVQLEEKKKRHWWQ